MMKDAEALAELMRGRRTVRRFRDEPIDEEMLRGLIETAAWAPSAGNRQDWLFTVVTAPELKARMAEAVKQKWDTIVEENNDLPGIEEIERYSAYFSSFADAPAVIAISAAAAPAVLERLLGDDAPAVVGGAASAAMAAQNLLLMAHAVGLGGCGMTGPLAAKAELAKALELGKRRELVCLVALGWPAEQPVPPPRKSLDEVARFLP